MVKLSCHVVSLVARNDAGTTKTPKVHRGKEKTMETMLQALVILGGLTFSLAASLLIEELIFGQIVRVAFVRRPENLKSGQRD